MQVEQIVVDPLCVVLAFKWLRLTALETLEVFAKVVSRTFWTFPIACPRRTFNLCRKRCLFGTVGTYCFTGSVGVSTAGATPVGSSFSTPFTTNIMSVVFVVAALASPTAILIGILFATFETILALGVIVHLAVRTAPISRATAWVLYRIGGIFVGIFQ